MFKGKTTRNTYNFKGILSTGRTVNLAENIYFTKINRKRAFFYFKKTIY